MKILLTKSKLSVIYSEYKTDDVDELFAWDPVGWELEFVQLSGGKLGFEYQLADLGGVSVGISRYGQSMLVRQRCERGGSLFALILEASAPLAVLGSELGAGEAVIMHSHEDYEFRSPNGMRVLVLEFDRDLPFPSGIYRNISAGAAAHFATSCREILSLSKEGRAALGKTLRKGLMAQLCALVAKASGSGFFDENGRYRLVSRALDWARARDVEQGPNIAAAAAALRVSERTLYRAFHGWAGTTPRACFAALQLHQFRDLLLRSENRPGAVATAAMDSGIDHLGRLAGSYRKLFGELPRETLRRRCG